MKSIFILILACILCSAISNDLEGTPETFKKLGSDENCLGYQIFSGISTIGSIVLGIMDYATNVKLVSETKAHENCKKQLIGANETIFQLRRDIAELKQKNRELNDKNEKLQEENSALKNKTSKLMNENEELKQLNKILKNHISELYEIISNLEEKVKEFSEKIKEYMKKYDDCALELKTVRKEKKIFADETYIQTVRTPKSNLQIKLTDALISDLQQTIKKQADTIEEQEFSISSLKLSNNLLNSKIFSISRIFYYHEVRKCCINQNCRKTED